MSPERATLREEIEWGESRELEVVKEWMRLSLYAAGAKRLIKSSRADEYDFMLLASRGLPLCYVEVKVRRSPLSRFGDAMFPWSKHLFAKRLAAFSIPLIGVTQYGCGALVEVDLGKRPSRSLDVVRQDRRHNPPVKHAIYGPRQIGVLKAGG